MYLQVQTRSIRLNFSINQINVFIVCSDVNCDPYKNHKESIDELKEKIRHVMSDNCIINFKFVNEISPLKSGKYLPKFLRDFHDQKDYDPNWYGCFYLNAKESVAAITLAWEESQK